MLFGGSPPTWALFLELAFAASIVILAGSRLTRLADRLAGDLQLGSAWVGLLLLATVTSLPEVVAGCTSVWIGNTAMAFATLYGSCSFNIVIIVLVNAVVGGGSVLSGAMGAHRLTSALGGCLISVSLIGLMLVGKSASDAVLAQAIESGTVAVILVTYLSGLRMVQRFEAQFLAATLRGAPARRHPPARVYAEVVILSAVLVGAAWWLAQVGDVLCDHPLGLLGGRKLGATFVGAAFLAVATSLPEIVTSYAAVRLGNVDLALGNIFGSNMFNIFVIVILKAVSLVRDGDHLLMYGPDFQADQAAIAGLLPILLTSIALIGLTYGTRRRIHRFGIDSVVIAATYAVGMILLLW